MSEFVTVTAPRYSSADLSSIDCMATWIVTPAVAATEGDETTPAMPAKDAVLEGPHPYTAHKDDVERHGVELYNDLVAGNYGPIAPYAAPPPVIPQSVSRRQLLIGLQSLGYITAAEAIAAAATGAVPSLLQSVIAALPAAQQVAAQITWASMSVALRTDPLLAAAATAAGKTAADLDALFVTCAAV